MNRNNSLATLLAIALAATTTSALAAADDRHDSHRPDQNAGAASATKPDSATARAGGGMRMETGMAGMGTQMQAMHEMHDKMMAAKTPEERNALMAEQMKVMQESMSMMKRVGAGTMPGGHAGKPADMAARQQMMEQRMDMMQPMMQMMMDRLPPAPAAK